MMSVCLTLTAYTTPSKDSGKVCVDTYKLDWLFKRNADANRYKMERDNRDSVIIEQEKRNNEQKSALSSKDSALLNNKNIISLDGIIIKDQGATIEKQDKKIARRGKIILGEGVLLTFIFGLFILKVVTP